MPGRRSKTVAPDAVIKALRVLDADQRAILDLSLRQRLDDQEVAAAMGLGPPAVAALRTEAIARLSGSRAAFGRAVGRQEMHDALLRLSEADWRRGTGDVATAADPAPPGPDAARPAPEAPRPAPASPVPETASSAPEAASPGREPASRAPEAASPGREPASRAPDAASPAREPASRAPDAASPAPAVARPAPEPAAPGPAPGATRPSRPPSADAARALGRRAVIAAVAVAVVAATVLGLLLARSQDGGGGKPAAPPRPGAAGPAGVDAAGGPPVALQPVRPGIGGRGTARLVAAGPDPRVELSVRGLPSADVSYVVWLFNAASDARPLGRFERGHAVLTLRPRARLRSYRFLDISLERPGVVRAHSGRSLLRAPTARLAPPPAPRPLQATLR